MNKYIELWTQFRVSWHYVTVFLIFTISWLVLNHWLHFDPEWSHLNLILSVMAELSAIILLIYTKGITDRNTKADNAEHIANQEFRDKLNAIHKLLIEDK